MGGGGEAQGKMKRAYDVVEKKTSLLCTKEAVLQDLPILILLPGDFCYNSIN